MCNWTGELGDSCELHITQYIELSDDGDDDDDDDDGDHCSLNDDNWLQLKKGSHSDDAEGDGKMVTVVGKCRGSRYIEQ